MDKWNSITLIALFIAITIIIASINITNYHTIKHMSEKGYSQQLINNHIMWVAPNYNEKWGLYVLWIKFRYC